MFLLKKIFTKGKSDSAWFWPFHLAVCPVFVTRNCYPFTVLVYMIVKTVLHMVFHLSRKNNYSKTKLDCPIVRETALHP